MRYMATTQTQIGTRRQDSWWEPSYDPRLINPLPICDWLFTNSTGAHGSFLPADTICSNAAIGEVARFTGLTFTKCNLQGDFVHRPSILFDRCRFIKCDFAFSKWRFATFRNCQFEACSISLSSFCDCEFRDCSWISIGFSGSKTDFERTFVTNPSELIAAGFSGTDPNRSNDATHRRYQQYRLEGTKAHVARNLLYSHERVGDDPTFYETAKRHDLQQSKARWHELWYRGLSRNKWHHYLLLLMLPAVTIEQALLRGLGLLNGWGSHLFRPLFGLVVTTVIFALLYQHLPLGEVIDAPWQKAFDISNVAGYGSQANNSQPVLLRRIEGLQLILSILFYTVFFSTAVARNSRAR